MKNKYDRCLNSTEFAKLAQTTFAFGANDTEKVGYIADELLYNIPRHCVRNNGDELFVEANDYHSFSRLSGKCARAILKTCPV